MNRINQIAAVMLVAVAGAFGIGFVIADAGRATPEPKVVYRDRTPDSCIRVLDTTSEVFERTIDVLKSGFDTAVTESFLAWMDTVTSTVNADANNCRALA